MNDSFSDVWMLSGMMFIFLSLLELAVVGFMCRDEGMPRRTSKKKSFANTFETEEFSWKEVQMPPSPRLGLRQFWVENRCSSISNNNEANPRLPTDSEVILPANERSSSIAWKNEFSTTGPLDPTTTCTLPATQRRRQRSKLFMFFYRIRKGFRNITPEKVDKYSAIMFPTAYFLFNAL